MSKEDAAFCQRLTPSVFLLVTSLNPNKEKSLRGERRMGWRAEQAFSNLQAESRVKNHRELFVNFHELVKVDQAVTVGIKRIAKGPVVTRKQSARKALHGLCDKAALKN